MNFGKAKKTDMVQNSTVQGVGESRNACPALAVGRVHGFISPRIIVVDHLFPKASAFTFVEVIVSAAILALALGMVMTAAVKGLEVAKWQSDYETACSYAEQGLEYALFVPYSDFSNTAPSESAPNWVSNSLLYTTATATNFIATTQMGTAITLTNVTYLATQTGLPLDDLGSYVLNRDVVVTDRTVLEPGAANLNYKLITVSNTWVFCGRTNPAIVYRVIRDMP
ncbi:MAG: hypothetical protein HY360_01800 [Verrucomicrobia bacterium]|nr:hypothetical protein [Verrucomicrobiota bacterium]